MSAAGRRVCTELHENRRVRPRAVLWRQSWRRPLGRVGGRNARIGSSAGRSSACDRYGCPDFRSPERIRQGQQWQLAGSASLALVSSSSHQQPGDEGLAGRRAASAPGRGDVRRGYGVNSARGGKKASDAGPVEDRARSERLSSGRRGRRRGASTRLTGGVPDAPRERTTSAGDGVGDAPRHTTRPRTP